MRAAVSSGFLSVADDRVSILVRQAELGSAVEVNAARARLDSRALRGRAAATGRGRTP